VKADIFLFRVMLSAHSRGFMIIDCFSALTVGWVTGCSGL